MRRNIIRSLCFLSLFVAGTIIGAFPLHLIAREKTENWFVEAPPFHIESVSRADGTKIVREYDILGQLIKYYSTDNSFFYSYKYGPSSRPVEITDHVLGKMTKRRYDSDLRIQEEVFSNGLRVKIVWNAQGQRDAMILPDGSRIEYTYLNGVLRSIKRIGIDGTAKYKHRYKAFDSRMRPSDMNLIGACGSMALQWDKDGTAHSIISSHWSEHILEKTADIRGKPVKISFQDPLGRAESEWMYNQRGQVIEEKGPWNQSYCSPVRSSRHLRSSGDRDIEVTSQTIYTYDLNGNVIGKSCPSGKWLFYYDAQNRLTEIEEVRVQKVHYYYDALDRRTEKIVHDWTEDGWIQVDRYRYFFDGMVEIGAVNSSGRLTELRVLGLQAHPHVPSPVAIELDGVAYAPITDHRGSIRMLLDANSGKPAEFYRYSALGEEKCFNSYLESIPGELTKNPWRYGGKRIDPETQFILMGRRYYDPETSLWMTSGDNSLIKQKKALISPTAEGNFGFSSFLQSLGESTFSAIAGWYEPDSLDGVTALGQRLFGNLYVLLNGHNDEDTSVGTVGRGEISKKVRITHINGILTYHKWCKNSASGISTMFGGVNVHFIHRRTRGITSDLWDVLQGKVGLISTYAEELAATWKRLIVEMGGVHGGGKILHFAHSSGGVDTCTAAQLLSPEERDMITVYTFGSAKMVPPDLFHQAENFVSLRDGVSLVCALTNLSDATFVGNLRGPPMVDHWFLGETYQPVIEDLGRNFIQEYGRFFDLASCQQLQR